MSAVPDSEPIPSWLHVVVYFAQNPEEALTADDASTKFDIPGEYIKAALRLSVRKGLLEYLPLIEGRERPKAYRAGPVLLRMIGAAGETTIASVMQACGALHVEHGTVLVDL